MSRYVFDTDAWLFARGLRSEGRSLLDAALNHVECVPISLTQYVEKHELSTVQHEIVPLLRAGKVRSHKVLNNDPNLRRLKQVVHKGEAETLSWLLSLDRKRPVFVSCDQGALGAAKAEGLSFTDLLGLTIDLVRLGALAEDDARTALSVWDDKLQKRCRPADWVGYDTTVGARQTSGFPFGPSL